MKLTDIILLSLSAALVVVGTHLTITSGISLSYPVFMLAVALLFWYRYRKNEQLIKEEESKAKGKSKKKK
ncbi:hypothetical protein MM239_00190 [Belliella sp. DSM 111904]|uniref:Uncharacterized protein n=1 Tax=Belliella filtrata TaxID=2923435 RepID=A0ABS9UUE5_9BACT|nr:hypothetical protein [Belliella filtrata]MCH7407797.1 hypothetical protein [Belliella filtrata]